MAEFLCYFFPQCMAAGCPDNTALLGKREKQSVEF